MVLAIISVSGYTTITYTGVVNTEEPEVKEWRMQDPLNNWDRISSRSDGWMLEGNNPYNAFDHDLSRARRIKF